MPTLTRLLLLFACLLLGPLVVIADELPKDTNTIESLTPEQARKLAAEFKGDYHLSLNGLTTLDAATAKALVEFKCIQLYLNGLTTLDTATAKALAEFKGGRLDLFGLTTLDAVTAKALTEFKGVYLLVHGLTTLDADTAKVLAEFKAWDGQLPKLTIVDAATAKALAEFKGQTLHLNGLTTLDAAAAKALAASDTWNGFLPSLTGFESPDSVAVAKALAARKGPLSLPNLKTISPKTLSALIEKEDVEIPLIKTLELIPEPDGSVTEDFVIPKGFETRQKRQQYRKIAPG